MTSHNKLGGLVVSLFEQLFELFKLSVLSFCVFCEDMIAVPLVTAACVSLWRVPNLQAVTARGCKTLDGQAIRTAGRHDCKTLRSFLQHVGSCV